MIRRTNDKQTFQLSRIASVLSLLIFPKLIYLVQKYCLLLAQPQPGQLMLRLCPVSIPPITGSVHGIWQTIWRAARCCAAAATHFVPVTETDQWSWQSGWSMFRFSTGAKSFLPTPPSIQTSAGVPSPSYRRGTREFCLRFKAARD
jgi:hypothetical protein